MNLPTKTFNDFVSGMTSSWASAIGLTPALQVGDPLLAMFEAVSGQLLFIVALIQLVNAVSRAQTSTGADLDSFYGQFRFTRLGGNAATGTVTFTAFVPSTLTTPIPAGVLQLDGTFAGGVLITTIGGGITYQVVPDTNQPTFDPIANAYVLPAGQTTLTVTVQATVVGIAGNVSAGSTTAGTGLLVIATSVPGIDAVINPVAIANGIDAESDSAFSSRFILYLNSLSKAIRPAIAAAIESVQPGLIYTIIEQYNFFAQTLPFADDQTFLDEPGPLGVPLEHFDPGNFFVVVDDGSGSPPANLITKVFNAIDAVRGFTIRFQVYAPIIVNVNVVLSITSAPGANHANVVGLVAVAVENFINGLSLSTAILPLTRLAQIAYEASPLVVNVPLSSMRINGLAADLKLSVIEIPRTGLIEVQ